MNVCDSIGKFYNCISKERLVNLLLKFSSYHTIVECINVLTYMLIYVIVYHIINLYILFIMGIFKNQMKRYKSFSSNN
jgi:DNA integrity scanning protein DisA with diadenylate cyclase activity